ncbi:hypothetical protein CEXT_793911 [Caerostris extrusa]|uniref:Uncharacterized protein n=1 Tax=Caerostris extrusa TaxID=172846 RepID=A0AAV4PM50_CAEEX|nr:hypothetical protein CEXT_793911 [Caerostris extrusa]
MAVSINRAWSMYFPLRWGLHHYRRTRKICSHISIYTLRQCHREKRKNKQTKDQKSCTLLMRVFMACLFLMYLHKSKRKPTFRKEWSGKELLRSSIWGQRHGCLHNCLRINVQRFRKNRSHLYQPRAIVHPIFLSERNKNVYKNIFNDISVKTIFKTE